MIARGGGCNVSSAHVTHTRTYELAGRLRHEGIARNGGDFSHGCARGDARYAVNVACIEESTEPHQAHDAPLAPTTWKSEEAIG
ncbi:hypothetical protein Bphy_1714 [Paraburkholderia phymatum STM815]|uniref:Uncharacterized protein n=1 Tax=Paraburkholderia phymatum (strain DSM 17167 / CIP 108236 / LMG 21445 / STM815) TaxID=391038 RepID=B2JKR9_PARP8|nr:hypothetical protein Bphy_1714 [Paraburkholderia phymatum STM815]